MFCFMHFVHFFYELCDFSWIVRSDAIWGWLCEIAPSRNTRRPDTCQDHWTQTKLQTGQKTCRKKIVPNCIQFTWSVFVDQKVTSSGFGLGKISSYDKLSADSTLLWSSLWRRDFVGAAKLGEFAESEGTPRLTLLFLNVRWRVFASSLKHFKEWKQRSLQI